MIQRVKPVRGDDETCALEDRVVDASVDHRLLVRSGRRFSYNELAIRPIPVPSRFHSSKKGRNLVG